MATNNEFKIEKGIPAPSRSASAKYPFGDMDVGDSFVARPEFSKKAQVAASDHGRRHGKRFVTRRLPDGSQRVWRVE